MSIFYNDERSPIQWEQQHIWTKTQYWLPTEDEDLKNEKIPPKTKAAPDIEMLETALLSEKVIMYTLQDCVLSKIQTEILATLLPSELITQETLQGKTRTHFVGVLMFGDVSGFTALCEKYFAEGGRGGTYKLTATLNSYIGAMVDVIYSYGGDIIKFSGDAFLAVWKVLITDYIYEIIHKVIECAMYIQHALGSFETDANVLLRVKLAISSGNVVFSSIGAEQCKYYVIYGRPVDDVKEAQDTCVSGDVVLAPSAWDHCSKVNYLYTNKDEKHIQILRIIYHPMQVTRKIYQLPPKHIVDLEKKYKYQITRYKTLESATDLNIKYETVRPEVDTAAERQIGPYLRPYLIPPVVAQVDAEQPLEYLTEMRQVTTVFINVVVEKRGTIETIEKVDEVYTNIWQVVHKQMGVVNKVCMFDKDIMFLVIFGLRGAHHEYNAFKSLKCAYQIRSIVSQMRHIMAISCGVTVGMAYCGVVGHPLRQEYTVIGAPVNKAARLMMYYPNKVSCDQQTYFNSGLSSIYFIEQEEKVLKGIGKVGGIYEYTEGKRGVGNVNIYHLPPLLGQETELSTFQAMLKGEDGFPCGVMYSGENGMGKSRLLEELLIMCVNGPFRTLLINLHSHYASMPFHTIQQIFKHIFNMGSDEEIRFKQERVTSYLNNTEYEKFVCLLNPILGINITDRPTQDIFTGSISDLRIIREKVFRKLIEMVCVDMIIFIDNIEYCDNRSADLLPIMLQEGSTALVMTVNKKSFLKARRWFKNVNLIIFQLENLEYHYVAPLACQLLNVRAIPTQIENMLLNQPELNPGWCQRYLQSLQDSKAIIIEKMQRKTLQNMSGMIVPDIKLLQRRVIGQEFRPTRITFVNYPPAGESMDEEVSICSLVKTTGDIEQTVPATIEAMIMSAFDCLSPFEQLLLKCGSVIGETFSREMLHAVLFKRSPRLTAQAIRRLFEMHILSCAHSEPYIGDNRSFETNLTLTREFDVSCYCKHRSVHDDFEEAYKFPYYAFCNAIQFTVPLFRIKTYDLLPTNQKVLFHKRVAAFLEIQLNPPDYLKKGIPTYWQMVLHAMSSMSIIQGPADTKTGTREKAIKFRELKITSNTKFQPVLYEDIIHHLNKAGLKEQEILMIVEYSQAALFAGCTRRALNALFLAEERLQALRAQHKYDNYDFKRVSGKLLLALAQSYNDLSYFELATFQLQKSKQVIFGNTVTWFLKKNYLSNMSFTPVSKVHSLKAAHWMFGNKSLSSLMQIEYFNLTCNSCMRRNQWHQAKSWAMKAVILVIKSSTADFCLICYAFSNLADAYNHLGRFKTSEKIQRIGMGIISRMQMKSENVIQTVAYGKLITSAFLSMFLQGKLEECLKYGENALLLGYEVGAHDANLFIQTIIINVQMRMKKIDKLNSSIDKLKTIKHPLTTVHINLCCLIIHLYTGVMVKSTFHIMDNVWADNTELSRPLAIVLGLYFIRRDESHEYEFLNEYLKIPKSISRTNVQYELMYYEFMLINIVRKMNKLQFDNSDDLHKSCMSARELGKQMAAVIFTKAPHLLPRLFLLTAYLCQINEDEGKSNINIKKALHLSTKYGDLAEYEWIMHNKLVWENFNKSKVVAHNIHYIDTWVKHSASGNQIYLTDYEKYHMHNLLYALPLTIYSMSEYNELKEILSTPTPSTKTENVTI